MDFKIGALNGFLFLVLLLFTLFCFLCCVCVWVFSWSSSCVLCTQCCQFLWIVHLWLCLKRLFDLLLMQTHCLWLIIFYHQSFTRNFSFIWCHTLTSITPQREIKEFGYAKCPRLLLHLKWQSGGLEGKNYVHTIFFKCGIFIFLVSVFLFWLLSFYVLCTQCCQCLWIAYSWFLLQFSLTFIALLNSEAM